jgi:hypothetical protein
MTATTPLAFPGSRKLAGWWRQLASYHPQGLWVGHLLLHHVEALVRLRQRGRPDPFSLFLLRALALGGPGSAAETLEGLNDRFHLDRQVLRQALRGLEDEGLVQRQSGAAWTLTALGRQAVERQEYSRDRHERQTFHFVENRAASGNGPHFLDLHNSTGIPWPVVEGHSFDVRSLRACLDRPADWKQRHGFPLDVQDILGVSPAAEAASAETSPPPWRRVIVDRPERVLAALVLAPGPDGGQRLLGLAVQQDGWVLRDTQPLFVLGAGWPETFPDLAADPGPEAWRQAWRAWGGPRALPGDEIEACTLERQGERLRVTVPPTLMERLRAARSDALKGETWLLAGEGWVRTAALVEVVGA